MPLCVTLYVAKLPEPWATGWHNGPIVRILKAHRSDPGIHAHEYEHVRQWWRTAGLIGFLYPISRRVRLWSESRAYAEQIRVGGITLEDAAGLLVQHYGLHLSLESAMRAIES